MSVKISLQISKNTLKKRTFAAKSPLQMRYILTGANRGIGHATLIHLAQQADNRIVAFVRRIDELLPLQATYPNIFPVVANLQADKQSLLPAVEAALAHLGQVDVLINNAAVLHKKAFVDLNEQDIQDSFAVNLYSIIYLIQHLLPHFASPAHIVNIGSMGGFQGSQRFEQLSIYAATKAALANLTESLALELDSYRISVNCLALGAVQTDMLQAAFPNYTADQTPQQIAHFISEFATHGHRFFNGKILPVSIHTP